MRITNEICIKCKYSTTDFPIKALGIKTLRCQLCGCFIALKSKIYPVCPKFKTEAEYMMANGNLKESD